MIEGKAKAKTLTSYRRWILKAYNAKSAEMSDEGFCKRHRIKLQELKAWQWLAGQELAAELNEMAHVERAEVGKKTAETRAAAQAREKHKWYSSRDFYEECAKVIEVTSGGRVREHIGGQSKNYRCELARYRLLQKIASLPSSDRNYRRFTRMRGEL